MFGLEFGEALLLVAFILLPILTAFIAHTKGRSAFVWLIYGFLTTVIAFIHVLFVSDLTDKDKRT